MVFLLVHSARSIRSSLRSEEIILPDEAVFSRYDDVIAEVDLDVPTAVQTTQEDDQGSQVSIGSVGCLIFNFQST